MNDDEDDYDGDDDDDDDDNDNDDNNDNDSDEEDVPMNRLESVPKMDRPKIISKSVKKCTSKIESLFMGKRILEIILR